MSAPPSEATRPATVDERVRRERERIRAQVRESRQRQGLPAHVRDSIVLDRLAGRLLERRAGAGNDDGATRRDRGREAGPVATASGAVSMGSAAQT